MISLARLRHLWAPALVISCTVPLVAHAMRAHRDERRLQRAMFARAAQLEASPIAHMANGRSVTVNGTRTFFRTSSIRGSLDAALEGIRSECRSGDRATMLGGIPARAGGDGQATLSRPLVLERIDQQAAGGAHAILCVFRENDASLVRYSMVKRADDATASIITVSTETTAPLEELFPAEGDAPGGDFDGVPRPPGSRRTFAATLEGDHYGVRIYETGADLPNAVAAYDDEMRAHGWSSSSTVATALPDARVYAHGDVEMVASFRGADGNTQIAVAPLKTSP